MRCEKRRRGLTRRAVEVGGFEGFFSTVTVGVEADRSLIDPLWRIGGLETPCAMESCLVHICRNVLAPNVNSARAALLGHSA